MKGAGRQAKARRAGPAAPSRLLGTALPCPSEWAAFATELFGDHGDAAERFAGHLAAEGPIRGLIGPREVPRLWDRHLLNCAVLSDLIPQESSVGDVGSGAGLPGVVLAIARPDLTVTLIEPMLRRATWLIEVVRELNLSNTRVIRARAEVVPQETRFDVVTARAVAALQELIPLCLPLTNPGGCILAMKGARASQEVAEAADTLHHLDLSATIVSLGEGRLSDATMAVRITRPPAA